MIAKYPIRKYMGKYESWLLHLYGRKVMLYHDKYLERFFNHFPEAIGVEQFGTPDVHAYKTWREGTRDISPFKLMQEIKSLEKFYRFLIENQGLPLSNPAKPFIKNNPRTIVRKNKDSLRLDEYRRLLEACVKFEPRLVHWMTRLVQGVRPCSTGLTSQMAGRLFKKVAVIAGMPYVTMSLVRRSLRHGLWKEIIKDWSNVTLANLGYENRSNSPLKESQLSGDPFGQVNVPSSDVWPPVSDSSDHAVPISGVTYQEDSPEA